MNYCLNYCHFLVCFLFFLLSLSCGNGLSAQIKIWEGTGVRSNADITPYLVDGGSGASVIVCPGGSYFWLDEENEGHAVARWLQSHGYNAFVLRYRVGGVPAFLFHYRYLFHGYRYPAPQDDLRQAVRYIRSRASEWNVDTCRIGMIGFSAGGHLVMSAGAFFHDADRPWFVAPIYPVVTMSASCTHERSRRALLGENRMNNKMMRDSLSLEKRVGASCPPVFLVNCKDDPTVDYHNSILLDSALTDNGVSHLYLQYSKGGHGFGVKEECEASCWKKEFIFWLNVLNRYTDEKK